MATKVIKGSNATKVVNGQLVQVGAPSRVVSGTRGPPGPRGHVGVGFFFPGQVTAGEDLVVIPLPAAGTYVGVSGFADTIAADTSLEIYRTRGGVRTLVGTIPFLVATGMGSAVVSIPHLPGDRLSVFAPIGVDPQLGELAISFIGG